ncbi:hypothetical protein ES703_86835 [subsurface metagenome]
MVIGGDFEVIFKKGFEREGEFSLAVRVYPGPTFPLDSIVFPPAPAFATEETTFIVAGEALPPEERFHDFRIVSYSKNSGPPVTPPAALELEVGDRCRVNVGFEHKGAAETGKFHAAIWTPQLWDPHDEILFKEQSFSVPSSAEWETAEYSVDIVITSAISPGSYGLYCKIMGITGADVFTPYYEDVITIVGVPTEGIFSNLQIISYEDTLDIGDTCHVKVSFDYQGPRLTRTLYAAIWVWQLWDPHDEILKGSKTITVPESEVPTPYEDEISIPITTAIDPGGSPYGLYAKICHGIACVIVDTKSPYLEEVITITGIPVKGEFKNFSISWSPDPAVLNYGDKLTVTHHFDYRGPRYTGADIRTAIGNRHHTPLPIIPDWFDEILYTIAHLEPFGPNEDWEGYDVDVDILITTAISPRVDYDLYSKLTDIPGPDLYDYKDDIIEIVEAPPEGAITGKWINKAPEGSKIPIPTEVKADNNTFEVGIRYKNYSGFTVTGGCKVEVRDPDGILRASPPVDWTGMSHNEELSKEYNICRVDKPGDWTVHIDFLMDSTVVDDYDGLLFTAVEEVVPPTVDFSLSKPSASPSHVDPGDSVTIRCPITSLCTKSQTITVKAKIYEGSILPGHGDKLDELSKTTTILPGQTKDVTFYHTAIGTDAERRDVEVEVYVGGTLIVQDEWDDIFYVAIEAPEYKGTISKKQLKYNATARSIPVSNVPQDKSGIVSIWGRNDMASNQKMGIWWQVKDPDGNVVEEYAR